MEYYLKDYGITYEQLLDADNRLELILNARLGHEETLDILPGGSLTPLAELEIELKKTKALLKNALALYDDQKEINFRLSEDVKKFEQTNSQLSEEAKEFEQTNFRLSEEVKEFEQANECLKRRDEQLTVQLDAMKRACEENELLYKQVLESTSFRCTKPLRLAADFIKKIKGGK